MAREAIIEWYDGSVTKETVIDENDNYLFFDVKINGSYYAPKEFEKINK